jgi:four helix bundle protein
MGVSRFEDLTAWQRARELVGEIYAATRGQNLQRDFGMCSQIQRAAVSIMSNVAEGFERNRPKEFHQALSTAKASCAEVRSLLYVALDVAYVEQDRFDRLMDQAVQVGRLIGGLRSAVARRIGKSALPPQHSAPSTQH